MTTQTATKPKSLDHPQPPAMLCLVSIDPTKNRYRYYRISHERTLWDEAVLVQTWGRLGTNGRTRVRFFGGNAVLQTEIAKLVRRRLQHGYQVIATAASGGCWLS